MNFIGDLVHRIASSSVSREDFWVQFISATGISHMAEVGVYRGLFAERVLRDCPSIEQYYMLDPWRNLGGWNKPANVDNDQFGLFLTETKSRTAFVAEKRVILRGKTTEVVGNIPDESLDFVYIDADHTLKGITIDLLRMYAKVRPGGWIGGDDFCETIWQHKTQFEPTLVFPYAVYFCEATDSPIFGLPHRQFLICKHGGQGFTFEDLTGKYGRLSLREQIHPNEVLKIKVAELFSWIRPLLRMARKVVGQRS